MPAHCYGKTPKSFKLDDVVVNVDKSLGCENNRKLHLVAKHPLMQPVYTFSTCVCNEYYGLVDRHLVPLIHPEKRFIRFMDRFFSRLRHLCPGVSPLSLEELYASRSTHVKKRWRRVLTDPDPCARGDSYVKSFVKYEKYEAIGKAPRIIQGRSPKYTMHLAKFLIPMEHAVYKIRDSLNSNLRIFAKGRNALQRGRDIVAMQVFPRTEWLCIDHSRFDSRVGVEHLKACHRFYRMFCKDPELNKLLSWQLNNVCFSRGGIFYKCKGRRMSGDIDTGFGNPILNYAILRYVLQGIPSIIYLDGDDSVVSFDASYTEKVKAALRDKLGDTGMKSTFSFVQRLEDVEFCQSKVVWTRNGPILGRNPIRAISRMCWALESQDDSYFPTVCEGEIHSSSGVPIIYDFAKKHRDPLKLNTEKYEYRHRININVPVMEPIDDARVTQAVQWDL